MFLNWVTLAMEAESNPVSCPDPQKCSVRSHNSQWRTVLVEETKLLDLIWKTIKLSYLLQVTNKPISNYRTHRRASGRSFYRRKSRLSHRKGKSWFWLIRVWCFDEFASIFVVWKFSESAPNVLINLRLNIKVMLVNLIKLGWVGVQGQVKGSG